MSLFFTSRSEFRRWLEENHSRVTELWVGFYKKKSGLGGLTYAEAVQEALCFGWIDGVLKPVDATRYLQRFTPRRARSVWSNVNVAHVERLTAAGQMHPAGLAAFAARTEARTGIYSFEARNPYPLSPDFEQRFRANAAAWTFFSAQAPWYRRAAIHKVMSPKQTDTRERWLARLIADSAAGRRLDALKARRGSGV